MIEGKPSKTALGPALRRATESQKSENQRLCYDQYARYFITKKTTSIGESWLPRWFVHFVTDYIIEPGVGNFILVRTRVFDDFLIDSLNQGFEQFVVMGAGYDSRAGRFFAERKDFPVFEVDFPATQAHKISLLKTIPNYPLDRIHFVPVDFTKDSFMDRLLQSGYSPSLRTLFMWEGVTYYIHESDVDKTLRMIHDHSRKGSRIIFDYYNRVNLQKYIRTWHDKEEPLIWGLHTKDMENFLSARGFSNIVNNTAASFGKPYYSKTVKKRFVCPFFSIVHAENAG
ncbi:MAG: SAM-dependent methyltransferase [Planctomycetia bacterium]|nr:SAM-dependent methyltransferase [Planctomycetia bacterium]